MPHAYKIRRPDGTTRGYQGRYRDKRGKQHTEMFRTEAEAKHFSAAGPVDIRRGTHTDPAEGRKRFADRAEQYARRWNSLADETRKKNRSQLNVHLLSRFGDWRIADITRDDIQEMVDDLNDAGYVPSTINEITRTLRGILSDAVNSGQIAVNPAHDLNSPTEHHEEADHITQAELDDLADAVDPWYRAAIYVQGLGGLRIGEMAGLLWLDVDFDHGLVTVRAGDPTAGRRSTRKRGRLESRALTKTAAGRRVVPMVDDLAAELHAHRDRLGALPRAPVFTSPRGEPLHTDNWRSRVFYPAAIAAGLGEQTRDDKGRLRYQGIVPHTLRHTAAALWIDSGVPTVVVGEWLGHEDPAFTVHKYGHSRPESQTQWVAAVQARIDEARRAAS